MGTENNTVAISPVEMDASAGPSAKTISQEGIQHVVFGGGRSAWCCSMESITTTLASNDSD